jgi:cytochrome c oxidase cbb3-type subunit 3
MNRYKISLSIAALFLIIVSAGFDHSLSGPLKDRESLKNGLKLFKVKCAVCHGDKGEGNIGPNLTDNFWIHGPKFEDISKIISIGNVGKGMIGFEGKLTHFEIREVASYVYLLRTTSPPDQKKPEGKEYRPDSH